MGGHVPPDSAACRQREERTCCADPSTPGGAPGLARRVANMKKICERLPKKRFEPFVLFAKLAAFTADEIALAHTLNGRYRQRAILFTQDELEPCHVFDRTRKKLDIKAFSGIPEQLAAATAKIYFSDLADSAEDNP